MMDVPRADKSGAKVTAVQTLREFRRRLNFAQRRGVASPSAFAARRRLALWFLSSSSQRASRLCPGAPQFKAKTMLDNTL